MNQREKLGAVLGLALSTACSPTTAKIGAGTVEITDTGVMDIISPDETGEANEPEVDYTSPDGNCEIGGIAMSEHPGEPWVVPTSELSEFTPGSYPVTNGLLTLGFNYWQTEESNCEGLEFQVEVNGENAGSFTFEERETGSPRLFIKRIALPPSDAETVHMAVYTPEGDQLMEQETTTRISNRLTAPHWIHMLYERMDELPPEIEYEDSNHEAVIPNGEFHTGGTYTVNDSSSHFTAMKQYLYDADLYRKDTSWLTASYNPDDYWDEDPLLRWQAAVAATQVLGLTYIEGVEDRPCNDYLDFAAEPYSDEVLAFARYAPDIAMDASGNCIPDLGLIVRDTFSVTSDGELEDHLNELVTSLHEG